MFDIRFELQQLQFDLQVIVLAHGAVFELDLADVDGLLKALQVHLREFESGLRKLGIDEETADLESKTALVIVHLRACYGSYVFGGMQAAFPFLAALDRKSVV